MPRALFEKTGSAVYISHLDLMRLFQRAFKRAGLPLTHTQGFNPRPSVSIALPLSLGVSSECELLDFDLEGEMPGYEEMRDRLNCALISGVHVREVYNSGSNLKNLALLQSVLTLEFDDGIPQGAAEQIRELFSRPEVIVEKKNRNGVTEQNVATMIRRLSVEPISGRELELRVLGCCQNPTLNPMQLVAAMEKYLPEVHPDFAKCRRVEIYDTNEEIFR